MSSILRALKKVEQEKRPRTQMAGFQQSLLPNGHAYSSRQRFSQSRFLLYSLICLVLGLPIVGWYIGRSHQSPRQPSSDIQEPTIQPAAPAPQSSARYSPETATPDNIQTTPKYDPAVKQPPALPPIEAIRPRQDDPPVTTTTSPVTVPDPPAPMVPNRKIQKPSPEEVNITPLEDPDLQIQALVWSPRPERRFVMINGKVVLEGEKIIGYRIVTINRNSMTVEKAGQLGVVFFQVQ